MRKSVSLFFWVMLFAHLAQAQDDPFRNSLSNSALKAAKPAPNAAKADTVKPKKNIVQPIAEEMDTSKEKETKALGKADPNAGDAPDDVMFLDDALIDKEDFEMLVLPDMDAEDAEVKSRKFDDFLAAELHELGKQTPVITCQQLKVLLANNPSLRQLSVIDARSQEAFEISHIPNARRAGYKDFSNEKIWSLNRKTMMVVYGEAAPESEFVAKKLQTLGFQNVYHLYGSITEWMNQKNEVVDKDGKKTNKLLFEDETRTKWLKKGKALTPKQLKK
jgi:rhodanese-related sulfurtransferase